MTKTKAISIGDTVRVKRRQDLDTAVVVQIIDDKLVRVEPRLHDHNIYPVNTLIRVPQSS